MAKLNMGILGGFSGTVGTVVGSTNKKGDDIIRAKSKKRRTVNSGAQLEQQSKFAMVTGFLRPLNSLLSIGLAGISGNAMSAYNYATRNSIAEAVKGVYPDLSLDYTQVRLSLGDLGMALGVSAAMEGTKMTFTWLDGATVNSSATDRALLVVYNITNEEVACSRAEYTRSSKTGEVTLPYAESGDVLLAYLFFQSATDELKVSTSQLAGEFTVG